MRKYSHKKWPKIFSRNFREIRAKIRRIPTTLPALALTDLRITFFNRSSGSFCKNVFSCEQFLLCVWSARNLMWRKLCSITKSSFFRLLRRFSIKANHFAYWVLLRLRPVPDLPIGYVGLSLRPQDPMGSNKLWYA